MTQRMTFDSEVALVTGAASGIGLATARLLAARGAKLVLADLDDPSAVAEKINTAGGTAHAITVDLTRGGTPDEMIEATLAAFGRLDILVCAAGFLRDKSFAKMPREDFDAILQIHLTSVAASAHAAWPVMRNQGGGRILLFTSHAGLFGNFGQANYSAAKLGVVGLMQTLAIEGERAGIRVNAIAPLAATPLAAGTMIDHFADRLRPDDVAATATFLCHRDAGVSGRIVAAAGPTIALAKISQGPAINIAACGEASPETAAVAWSNLASSLDPNVGAARQVELLIGNTSYASVFGFAQSLSVDNPDDAMAQTDSSRRELPAANSAVTLTADVSPRARAKAQLENRTFYQDVGDIRMFCEIRGRGPLLVLQNGIWLASVVNSENHQIAELAKFFTVLTFDSRGSGRTTLGNGPANYGRLANDTVNLMNVLGLERAHFFGHSDGGCISLELLMDYPERVQSATFCGTPVNHASYTVSLREAFMKWYDEARSDSDVFHDLRGEIMTPDAMAALKQRYVATSPHPEMFRTVMEHRRRCWSSEPDLSLRRLGLIERPTMVVCAGSDEFLPLSAMQDLARALPSAQQLTIPELTHDTQPHMPRIARSVSEFTSAIR